MTVFRGCSLRFLIFAHLSMILRAVVPKNLYTNLIIFYVLWADAYVLMYFIFFFSILLRFFSARRPILPLTNNWQYLAMYEAPDASI